MVYHNQAGYGNSKQAFPERRLSEIGNCMTRASSYTHYNDDVNRVMRNTSPNQTKANPNLIMVTRIPITNSPAQLQENTTRLEPKKQGLAFIHKSRFLVLLENKLFILRHILLEWQISCGKILVN